MSPPRELAMVEVGACPVCGDPRSVPHDSAPDTLVPEINRYLPEDEPPLARPVNVRRRCAGCGLVYLSPRLAPEDLREIYRLWYGHAYRAIFADPRHQAQRRQEFERHHLRHLRAAAPGRGRLLDVGCGSGLFLDVAAKDGWDATGLEFDAATAAWGAERFGIDIRHGTLATAVADGETWDAVTLFDYLEHTETPVEDLDRIKRLLSPGGVLMVRVPNASGLQARYMGADWLAVICNHLTYFTPATLVRTLEDRGFAVESVGAPNYRSEVDVARQRLAWLRDRLGARFGRAPSAGTAAPRPVAGPAGNAGRLLHSLWIEQVDHVGGWFSRGNFLTVVARRR